MPITYRYKVDESFFRTLFARQMRQKLMVFRPSVQVPLVLILGVGGWWFLRGLDEPAILGALWVLLAFAFLSGVMVPRLLQRTILRAVRKNPEFGGEATVELSERGLDGSGPLSKGTVDWKAFTGAVRHPDGIILTRGISTVWLPDAALEGSTPSEATALVGSKLNLRQKG